jgi:acyl carrier protein
MTRDDIALRVRHLIASAMLRDPEEISLDSSLADLHVDSLDRVEIVMDTEEAFNVEISDAEAEEVQTVAQLVELVEKLLQAVDA